MASRLVIWIRRLVQVACLLGFVFLFLQTEGRGNDDLGYPVRLVLDFSPLIVLATVLATWVVPVAYGAALVVLLVTLVGGRVFCGWLCPMGTIHHGLGVLARRFPGRIEGGWRRGKYLLLVFLLAAAGVSLQLVGVFDPLSFLIRSSAVAVNPVVNAVVETTFAVEAWLPRGAARDAVETAHRWVARHLLAFKPPRFDNALPIALLFIGVVALNFVEGRFWCRYVCPLGALLGLVGSRPLLRLRVDTEKCNGCGLCASVCPGRADPMATTTWRASECMMCGNCTAVCPRGASSFRVGSGDSVARPPLDLGRRRLVLTGVAGLVANPVLRITPLPHSGGPPSPLLIRPPGSCPEPEFLARCVKCGECLKVCLTNGLQPAGCEHGIEALWTPVLRPRLGYCEYRCTLCGQVCPTQAIKRLSLEEKVKTKIGLAMVDRSRCLPHAYATPCIVCEEVCPLPKKAIWVETMRERRFPCNNPMSTRRCASGAASARPSARSPISLPSGFRASARRGRPPISCCCSDGQTGGRLLTGRRGRCWRSLPAARICRDGGVADARNT